MSRANVTLENLIFQNDLCMYLFWSRFAVLKPLSFVFFPGAIVRILIQEKDEEKLF